MKISDRIKERNNEEIIDRNNRVIEMCLPDLKEDFSLAKALAELSDMELKELNRTLNRLYKERKNHESKRKINTKKGGYS